MADEATTTDEPNSAATLTDASAATEPSSSTTPQNEADPLNGGSVLGDAETPADEGGEGAGDTQGQGEASEGDGREPDAPELTGAPDGDYEITGLPEGMAIDTDLLEAASPVLKELNLSNAGASKVAGMFAEKVLPHVEKRVMDGVIGQVVAQRATWDAETNAQIAGGKDAAGNAIAADPIYAGKSLDQVRGIAAKALDRFGGDAKFTVNGEETTFRQWLKDTGNGNNPALVRFAFLAGSAISEDMGFERSGQAPATPKSREDKYYANG